MTAKSRAGSSRMTTFSFAGLGRSATVLYLLGMMKATLNRSPAISAFTGDVIEIFSDLPSLLCPPLLLNMYLWKEPSSTYNPSNLHVMQIIRHATYEVTTFRNKKFSRHNVTYAGLGSYTIYRASFRNLGKIDLFHIHVKRPEKGALPGRVCFKWQRL